MTKKLNANVYKENIKISNLKFKLIKIKKR